MGLWMVISLSLAAGFAVLIATGRWRRSFALFAIRPSRMTVSRLELAVYEPKDVERVDTILRCFAGGFNAMITGPKVTSCRAYCDSLPILYRPFAEEGTAMGLTLRRLFAHDPRDFEETLVKSRPEYRYLYYVGLGFWSGMRNHTPGQVQRVAADLDPLHRFLCFDGYGFKRALFDYPKDAGSFGLLDGLEGYARNAAYQGVGRAFYFLFMSQPQVMIEHIKRLGEFAADASAGVGLAAVFVNPDRLHVAQRLAAEMPFDWRDHFHLGMCFALKARSLNHLGEFEQDMSRLERGVQDSVFASIRECDRIELQVRARAAEYDGYCRWRGRVTAWMAENIEYPLAGVRCARAADSAEVTASEPVGEVST